MVGGQPGEVIGDRGAVPVARGPILKQREETVVADDPAQGVQGERATLVHPVVEHVGRTRIGQQQILRGVLEPAVITVGPLVGGLLIGQTLGEALTAALEAAASFDIASGIAGMIEAGAFTTLDLGGSA